MSTVYTDRHSAQYSLSLDLVTHFKNPIMVGNTLECVTNSVELKAAAGSWVRIKQMVWGAGQHIIDKRTVWELMEWIDEQHIA